MKLRAQRKPTGGEIFKWRQLLIYHSGTQNHDNRGRLKPTNGFRGFPQSLSRSTQFNLSELTAPFDSLPFNDWTDTSMTRCKFPKTFEKRKLIKSCLLLSLSLRLSVCLSVCASAWNKSAPAGRMLMRFDIWILFERSVEKFQSLIQTLQE